MSQEISLSALIWPRTCFRSTPLMRKVSPLFGASSAGLKFSSSSRRHRRVWLAWKPALQRTIGVARSVHLAIRSG